MATETDLCNDALGQIGAKRITALDDNSHNANLCSTFYAKLRDAELEIARWSFAGKRVALAQTVDVPLFQFAYSYQLPTDLLVIREFNGISPDPTLYAAFLFDLGWLALWWSNYFKLEGDKLYTNDAQAQIVYTARIEDPTKWSGLFYQGLSKLLGAKLSRAITKDERKAKELEDSGRETLIYAAGVDGQQGTIVPMVSNVLIWGR
jgi:hypothetical protein